MLYAPFTLLALRFVLMKLYATFTFMVVTPSGCDSVVEIRCHLRGGGRGWAEGAAAHPNFRRGAPLVSAEGKLRGNR